MTPTRSTPRRRTNALSVLALLALLVAALAGCGPGSSGGSEASSADAGGSTAGTEEVAPGSPTTPQESAPGTSTLRDAVAQAPLQRAVVATGRLRVETRQVEQARDEVLRRTRSWGGLVADEQTSSDDRGRAMTSTMVLRVPTPRFSAALAGLADLGRVTEQTRSSEDVTTQVVDNAARVRAAERSILGIERLLSRAEELGDVIRIESDLARRQADLDSLKSQQAYLADQTSLSTITLDLARPSRLAPPPEEARGFLAGLQQGWGALAGSGLAVLTVLGALLPFAALLTLVGTPLALVLRRRRTTAPGTSAGPATG